MNILMSPMKNRTPKNDTIDNFGHPVSKSWLRPWPPDPYLGQELHFSFKCLLSDSKSTTYQKSN